MDECQKAVELGFADEILTDEKKQTPTEAYMFGSKEFEMSLVNKITKRVPALKKGRNVNELKDKLVTIKKLI